MLALYRIWDKSDPLVLLPASSSQEMFRGAVAATDKDAVADRIILIRMPEKSR